jgi:beta-galactosidase
MKRKLFVLFIAIFMGIFSFLVKARESDNKSPIMFDGELFVGTCYQPVDRSLKQVETDAALMKNAGFKVVRMGDLSWDYFEKEEGVYTFDHFDQVMDQMHKNGIKVILDIAGLPAPLWLHRKYPGANLVAQNGTVLHPAERYMVNISDPDYRRLVKKYADKLTKRYANHPALIAIGFDNEIGNGFMSYSSADRERFIEWLKKRYGNLDVLNKAWATQRWSRHLSSWDDIQLPYGDGPGPYERNLDLRRYWSDVTIDVLNDLEEIRYKNLPNKPAISNLWDSSERKGFDYLSTYRRYVDFPAMGFYPGEPIGSSFDVLATKGALKAPMWFVEFTAGGGGYYGTKGRSRMWAYFGLLLGSQSVMAWTFNSHLGGEEQALFGLLDHDDTPSWKLDEFATIAREFKTLETIGFPRKPKPEVAFSYSFESRMASSPKNPSDSSSLKHYYTIPYMIHKHNAYSPLFKSNLDLAVVNISHEDLSPYKLLVVSGEYLLDKAAINAMRQYVQNGGTLVMTAFSGKVNEHSQWFDTPLPGGLTDVFGMRTREFYRTEQPLIGKKGKELIKTSSTFYEVLETKSAKVIANFENVEGKLPLITENQFGKGKAYYVATPADPVVMSALYNDLLSQLAIARGPSTPEGVFARQVGGKTLYVNSTTTVKEVQLEDKKKGFFSGKSVDKKLVLEPYAVEILE